MQFQPSFFFVNLSQKTFATHNINQINLFRELDIVVARDLSIDAFIKQLN